MNELLGQGFLHLEVARLVKIAGEWRQPCPWEQDCWLFTCSETPVVQNKEPAGTGMHRTLLCSPLCPWCMQELQDSLCRAGEQAPPWNANTAQRGGNAFPPVHSNWVLRKLIPVWLLGGFFACFLLSLGILVALQPR